MHRDAGLVADGGQQLQVRLVEPAGAAEAVHIQRAEDRVGGPQRHAHHRPDVLADDALPIAEPRVAARVVREDGNAVGDDAGHQRPAHGEPLGRLRLRPRRQHVEGDGPRARAPQDHGAPIGRQDVEDGAKRHVRQPLDVPPGGERLAHAMQRGEMPLGALEERQLQPVETRGLDAPLDDRLDRRLIDKDSLIRPLRYACRIADLQDRRAEPDQIAGPGGRLLDGALVDERPVRRVQILD